MYSLPLPWLRPTACLHPLTLLVVRSSFSLIAPFKADLLYPLLAREHFSWGCILKSKVWRAEIASSWSHWINFTVSLLAAVVTSSCSWWPDQWEQRFKENWQIRAYYYLAAQLARVVPDLTIGAETHRLAVSWKRFLKISSCAKSRSFQTFKKCLPVKEAKLMRKQTKNQILKPRALPL